MHCLIVLLVITCFKLNDNRLTAKTPPHPLKTPVYKKNQQGKNRKLNSKFWPVNF